MAMMAMMIAMTRTVATAPTIRAIVVIMEDGKSLTLSVLVMLVILEEEHSGSLR